MLPWHHVPPWHEEPPWHGMPPIKMMMMMMRQGRLGDTRYLDEVFITINGQRQYLWRAVNQDGDVLDILVNLVAIRVRRNASFASF